jgi:hypothetical protein
LPQRLAIERHAKRAGFDVVDWFSDAAVSGADRIDVRPGFSALLARIAAMASATSSSRRRPASPAI